jgi:hypothetical protein
MKAAKLAVWAAGPAIAGIALTKIKRTNTKRKPARYCVMIRTILEGGGDVRAAEVSQAMT